MGLFVKTNFACDLIAHSYLANCMVVSHSISTERHRAEVRRAVNDERLTTIAYQ